MTDMLGLAYYALPAVVIALLVAWGIALGYRSRRTGAAALLWVAIFLLAILAGRLADA